VLANVFHGATDMGHLHAPRADADVRTERRLYLEALARELRATDVHPRVDDLGREKIDQRLTEVANDIEADIIAGNAGSREPSV
jgi:hypothetical protein